jgi:hypothetical protein
MTTLREGSKDLKIERSVLSAEGPVDLLIGLVLAESVDGPDGGGDPAEDGDLQDQANNSGEGAAYGEEGQPGEEECDD